MQPFSDKTLQHQQSPVTAAAKQILASYLGHHHLPAVEAARLAIRVESLLASLMAGGVSLGAATAEAEEEAPAPRGARRSRTAAKSAPPARSRRAAIAPDEDQADLAFEAEEDEEEEDEDAYLEAAESDLLEDVAEEELEEIGDHEAGAEALIVAAEETAEEEEEEALAEEEPPAPVAAAAPPAPAPTPVTARAKPKPAQPEEIDLLTGGPLPPAEASDLPEMVFAAEPAAGGRKRKRPPRPAHKRRGPRDEGTGEG